MAAGVRMAEALWRMLRSARVDTPQGRILREDLTSAAFTLRAVLTAGLGRLESRGSFMRDDYPAQDDARWLRNSRGRWDPDSGGFHVDYLPVDAA
jgi:succinate dehydrogenase/fumarate reductase flavoprotein subunit